MTIYDEKWKVNILTEYRGKKSSIKGPVIAVVIFTLLIISILLYFNFSYGSIIGAAAVFLLWIFAYKGIILKIKIDDKKITIVRPLSRNSILIENIVFCAVHGIDDDTTLVYAFIKKRVRGIMSVKGIKPKLPYQEIIRLVTDDRKKAELDVNFNMAAKIPVSFVENSEELKNRILEAVTQNQNRLLKGQ
ncbi:MAG: hypothetical protein ACOZCL_13910 [Bacillota bacterium]